MTTTTHDLTYAYPSTGLARVHAPSSITDASSGARTFTWDANGNQTGATGGGGPTRVTRWDDENRVLSITDNGLAPTRFRYDASGQRTHKITTKAITLYPNQWASVRGNGVDGSGYLTGPLETNHVFVGNERVASSVAASSAPQGYWYHGNHLTSTGYVTDVYGAVTEHVEYYPFGAPWVQEQGAVSTPGPNERFLFTGKELDGETGLYYFGARYYDPRHVQWLSADPALETFLADGRIYSPARLGVYTYAWHSPVVLRDPDGRDVAVLLWVSRGVAVVAGGATAAVFIVGGIAAASWGYAAAETRNALNDPGRSSPASERGVPHVMNSDNGGRTDTGSDTTTAPPTGAAPGTYNPHVPMGGEVKDRPQDRGGPITNDLPVEGARGPHTQIGEGRTDRDEGSYTQGREWTYEGGRWRPVRDIDFTDHGRPEDHPNPHEHPYDRTTGRRLPPQPVSPVEGRTPARPADDAPPAPPAPGPRPGWQPRR